MSDPLPSAVGGPTAVYSNGTLAGDNAIAPNISVRIGVAVAAGSGTQVRVTLKAGASSSVGVQGISCSHVSIGVSTGTLPNTTATPLEIKFGGVSGVTLNTSLAQQTSDFTLLSGLTWTSTDTLVIICDQDATINFDAAQVGAATIGAFAAVWEKAATTSWNVAAPAGFTNLGTFGYAVVSVETQ